MNKKVFISALVSAAVMLSFSSCGEKNQTTIVKDISSSSSSQKGFFPDDSTVDLSLCCQNTVAYFNDKSNGFPEMDISIIPPNDKHDAFNIIIVTNEPLASDSDYVDLIRKCMENLNYQATVQDPRISPSSESNYGGLFEKYSVDVTATNLNDMLSRWYVSQQIAAGSHAPIEINTELIDLSKLPQ